MIERLVGTYAATHELTVVTADEAERLAVSAAGAWWMSPAALRERIDQSCREQDKTLKKLRGRGGGYRLGEKLEMERARRHKREAGE